MPLTAPAQSWASLGWAACPCGHRAELARSSCPGGGAALPLHAEPVLSQECPRSRPPVPHNDPEELLPQLGGSRACAPHPVPSRALPRVTSTALGWPVTGLVTRTLLPGEPRQTQSGTTSEALLDPLHCHVQATARPQERRQQHKRWARGLSPSPLQWTPSPSPGRRAARPPASPGSWPCSQEAPTPAQTLAPSQGGWPSVQVRATSWGRASPSSPSPPLLPAGLRGRWWQLGVPLQAHLRRGRCSPGSDSPEAGERKSGAGDRLRQCQETGQSSAWRGKARDWGRLSPSSCRPQGPPVVGEWHFLLSVGGGRKPPIRSHSDGITGYPKDLSRMGRAPASPAVTLSKSPPLRP